MSDQIDQTTPSPESGGPESQNSVETMTRPDELRAEFGIKKDTYYDDLKYLCSIGREVKPQKDSNGKVYLDPEQTALIRALRQHVVATGKREGFGTSNLAVAEGGGLESAAETIYAQAASGPEPDTDELMQKAQRLAAERMMVGDLVVSELANRLNFNDLTPELQKQVSAVQAATHPKVDPAQVATSVLSQWRSRSGKVAA